MHVKYSVELHGRSLASRHWKPEVVHPWVCCRGEPSLCLRFFFLITHRSNVFFLITHISNMSNSTSAFFVHYLQPSTFFYLCVNSACGTTSALQAAVRGYETSQINVTAISRPCGPACRRRGVKKTPKKDQPPKWGVYDRRVLGPLAWRQGLHGDLHMRSVDRTRRSPGRGSCATD